MAFRPFFLGALRGLAITGLAAGGLLAALTALPERGPVAAVFPPWWDGMRAITAASEGGSVLRLGLMNFVVLVAPAEPADRDRLRRAGAWLLLNPRGLIGCGIRTGLQSNDI
jgi:hypothetical protein